MYPYQRSKARAYAIPAVFVSLLAGYMGALGLSLIPPPAVADSSRPIDEGLLSPRHCERLGSPPFRFSVS